MGGNKSNGSTMLLPGGLAALVIMMGAASSPIAQPISSSAPQIVTREFTDPTAKPKRRKARGHVKREGDAKDAVGNFRSSDRLRRRMLVAIAGVPDTGRQWVKLQKVLRKYAPEVLTIHPRRLMQHPAARAAIR